FFFSSRRRHTRSKRDWSSDVCSSDLLVPKLGLVRAAILFGMINAVVALWSTFVFREQLAAPLGLRAACAVVLALLSGGMVASNWIASAADNQLYADEVIFERNTRYQRIVITKWK